MYPKQVKWKKKRLLSSPFSMHFNNKKHLVLYKYRSGEGFVQHKFRDLNPLTTRWSKSATLLWEIPVILVLYRYRCNFYTVELFLSAVFSKKQYQDTIYTTHFRSVYVPKSSFFAKKAVHCSDALLKKRKRFSLNLLNGYRYI